MTHVNYSVLQQRVQQRLNDLGMTVAEATRRGRLPKDFIYDLLNGRKKSVRLDNIEKLSLALDCDITYLDGSQEAVSIVDNIVDFDRPPVDILGEVATGIYVDKDHTFSRRHDAPDMPNLPPDTRFPADSQVDFYIRGDSINRFAPSGYILRCVLIKDWPEVIRPGDLLIVDRFQGELRERAAWRVRPTEKYIEFMTDTDSRREQISWKGAISPKVAAKYGIELENNPDWQPHDSYKPVAVVIFAYAEPRIRRMF